MRALAKFRQHFDWPFFILSAFIAAVGVLNLYSATTTTQMTLVRQQVLWLVLGFSLMLCTALVDYRFYYRWAYAIYALGLVGLVLVLLVGTHINHSQRWLYLAGFGVQPSEIMKVCLIVALARYLHDDPVSDGRTLKHLAIPVLLLVFPVALVLRQPDLGTALMIALIFLSVMALTKLKMRSMVGLALLAIVSFPLTWNYILRDYQRQRVFTFLDPASDLSGSGWQARQSLLAVGSGGFWGKGYRRGTQNLLHFLPERWTDFPFAVLAEEWGFVGSSALLALYLVLILWAVKLASQARDRFGAVVCVGVAALLFWHTVISVCMVTGMAPVVGVTLPLISYGGSSLTTVMISLGLVMNVSIRKTSF